MAAKWKAVATVGIWLGAGFAMGLGGEALQQQAATIMGSASTATFFVWFFGS